MAIRQFEPNRAIEILAPRYGSGYRIGDGLVLTAAHLLDSVGTTCTVRARQSFGKEAAQVVWKAQNSDLALIELPNEIERVGAITFGKLPKATAGEKLAFQMYAYPLWARTQRNQGSAAGGRQIEGTIYLSDRSPDGLLVLEAERLPPEATAAESEWAGASGAAIICDGLVTAVQSQHQNPSRSASLEASSLWIAYADEKWQQLLEKHGVNSEPEIVRLPNPEKSLEIAWHEVSRQLLENQLQLTTNPMTRSENIGYSVEQVYVPLGLVERKKVPRQKGDVSPERGSELYGEYRYKEQALKKSESSQDFEIEEIEVTQKFEYEQFLEQVLQQGQSPKSRGKKVAIVGEPGSGKTTLLQQIALWVSTQLPTSIVIWVSLADLEKKSLKEYIYDQWLTLIVEHYCHAEVSAQVKDAFIAQCQQGNVWLMLDGLDEMPVIANPLEERGWIEGTRSVLTCRVNLWTGKPLAGFDVFRTLEFSYPQQVEQFVAQWFGPQKKADWGQALCVALKEPGKERIRDLVKNPLRLTLLCFDWGLKGGNLPETQAELYRRYISRIYEWGEKKFSTTLEQQQKLNHALGELSLAAIDDQDKNGKARFRLRHRFVKRFLGDALLDLALQLGWLNKVGVDANDPTQTAYAFYHATFEEYFASLAVNDWGFFLPRKHRNLPVKEDKEYKTSYRIFEPQWKQVFLLWLGREDGELGQGSELKLRKQKEALIEALTHFRDGCRGFYADRAFLLAAAGIAEFKNYTQSDAIVNRLVQWQFGGFNLRKLKDARANVRRNLAVTALISIDIERKKKALEKKKKALVQLLGFNQIDSSIRLEIAQILLQIDPDNEKAIQALVQVLKSDQLQRVGYYRSCYHSTAAWVFRQIGRDNEKAIRALAQSLNSKQLDANGHFRVAQTLLQIDPDNEKAIQALVQLLKSKQLDSSSRIEIARTLLQIKPGNEKAIQVSVQLLESKQIDSSSRFKIAQLLLQTDSGNRKVIQAVARLLRFDQLDSSHRIEIAQILLQIDPGNEKAIQALVQLLKSEQPQLFEYLSLFGRFTAAQVLKQIGTGNMKVIRVLVQLLKSKQLDSYNLSEVAQILGQIDPGNEKAIQALVQLLKSDQLDSYNLSKVAQALRQIDPGNEKVIQTLVQLLDSDQLDSPSRSHVAQALWQIDSGNKKAIQSLVQLLESNQLNNDNRSEVAQTLLEIDPGDEKAIQVLVQLFESEQLSNSGQLFPYFSFSQVAWTLRQIGTGNEKVIQALVRLLESRPLDSSSRSEIVQILGQIGTGNEKAIQALVRLVESKQLDSYTRSKVVQALGQIGMGNEKAIQALVQLLKSKQLGSSSHLEIAQTLLKIDLGNEKAIQALVQLLKSKQLGSSSHLEIAQTLLQIDSGNEKAIQALVRLVESKQLHSYTRSKVVQALGQIGTGNEKVIQALVRLLESRPLDSSSRSEIVQILGQIGTGNEKAIQALVQLLKSKQLGSSSHLEIAQTLLQIDLGNEKAIQALVQLHKSKQLGSSSRSEVIQTLLQIDSGNEKAIQVLVQLLKSRQLDSFSRSGVIQTLLQIDLGSEKAIQVLVQLLKSRQLDSFSRLKIAQTLLQIDPGSEKAIQVLVRLVESNQFNSYNYNCYEAGQTLLKIDPGNKEAKQIIALLRHPFRSTAAYQLAVICAERLSYPEFYQAFRASRWIL